MATIRKLEPRKTVIGYQTAKRPDNGEPTEFKVFYGNWTEPEINGTSMHLPDDMYKEMLVTFLQSADGEEYEEPTDAEMKSLRADVELDMKRQKRKFQEEKERRANEAKRRSESASDEDVKRLQASVDALTTQINSMGISINDIRNEVVEDETDEDDEEDDDEEYEDEGFGTFPKVLLIIAVILCVLNFGLSACSLLGIFNKNTSTADETEKTQNTLVINGETYTIESTPMELADGQTKVSVYAITTTNENGQSVNKVIPLGDMNIAEIEKAAKESTATATPEAESEKKEETNTENQEQQANTEEQAENTDNTQQ